MAPPAYPAEELMRLTGAVDSVVVEYVVTQAGRVDASQITVITATAPPFTRAVREALLEAKFQPATQASKTASILVRQVFRFVRR